MIDGLIGGKLHGKPFERTGQSGKPFVTAKIRIATTDGTALFASVIGFRDSVRAALLAMDDADSIAISGELTVKTWIDRENVAHPALDIIAHGVLSAYHVGRKRRAVAGTTDEEG